MKLKKKVRKVQQIEVLAEDEQEELAQLLEQERDEKVQNKIWKYYPDIGPFRRELYPKHLQFFAAGAKHKPMLSCPDDCDGGPHRERAFIAANKIGKTEGVGAYEMALHLTGNYPDWWVGRRFPRQISAWAAGDTSQTTRDIIQLKLLGPVGQFGTGMIPKDCLIYTAAKGGLPGAVETIHVRHITGGRSELGLKSYDQGRLAFQGTNKHVIWLDEECKREVYTECLLRTMTVNGLIMLTFTPLMGTTDVVRDFMGIGEIDDRTPPEERINMETSE